MPNTNCLYHLKCPKCGSHGPFDIVTTCVATVTDDGVTDTRNHDWDEDSMAYCCNCDWCGIVLTLRNQGRKGKRV